MMHDDTAADVVNQQRLCNGVVLEMTKAEQERGTDPLVWATRLHSILASGGISVPSVEVAELLVSHICWSNNTPIAWKFLDKAIALRIVPPLFVLALLSDRVISSRKRYPVAYRLYMELLKRHAFSLLALINGPNYHKIMESIDDVLHFRQIFGVQSTEPGNLVVQFIFSIVWELLDASLDDENLLEHTLEKKSRWPIKSEDMEIECLDGFEAKKLEFQAAVSKTNTLMAIEIIGDFFKNKVASRILYLVRRNMPMHWDYFIQHLRLVIVYSTTLRSSKNMSPEGLLQLSSDSHQLPSRACKMSILAKTHMPSAMFTAHSEIWLPIDLYLEDSMNVLQVRTTSAAETLTGTITHNRGSQAYCIGMYELLIYIGTAGLVTALQALNQTTWHDAFLGLWIAALRLVQRESGSPTEGRCARVDASLCILLSIAILSVVKIVGEEDIMFTGEGEQSSISQRKLTESVRKRREDLVSSLQRLDDFEGLLIPPPPVKSLANQAAAKAMMFLSGVSVGSGNLNDMSLNDMPGNYSGNLRHLIVEACIARNVLDTSAYLWPGYVKGHSNQIPQNIPGWPSLMKGSPLTPTMISALVLTPATSLAEIERMYEVAVSGTSDEKIYAATILCGSSLFRGWNIQEHTGLLITKLLSPAVPADSSESGSHLIVYAPFLNAILVGVSSAECLHIFSLHGLVPQLAAALMPICEVFGSCAPNMSWTLNTGEEISSRAIFSNAFILLLKLWRFDQPPLNHVKGDVAPVGSHLTPDYLLLVHNSRLASYEELRKNQTKTNRLSRLSYPFSTDPVFLDSFPKLKCWYRNHQEYISSVVSNLVPGNTVHEVVEAVLSMMFRRLNRGQPSTPTNSDEPYPCLKFPAWDILEAVPFVLEATLTACAHGRLSPRDMTLGIKDLADFLPASLATIISYYSAEVSRGLWNHAPMNGIDWPSPALNLSMVEEQIKQTLAAIGVNVPCPDIGASSTVTIPLPMAALISLMITYRRGGSNELYLGMLCPHFRRLAANWPWPCTSVLAALWSQKVKQWTDLLTFTAAQTVFHHNNDAIVQLLRSCFTTALGINSSVTGNSGVGALLGHGFGSQVPGSISDVAPGILYLSFHRSIRNVMLITEEIVSLLMHTVKDIANGGLPQEKAEQLKNTKYGRFSLAAAMNKVKNAASLGASFVWITGGLQSVHFLFKEILPSWFISTHGSEPNSEQESGAMVNMLGGYTLAYFTMFCGLFAWGLDSVSAASKRRPKVLGEHFEYLASAMVGKISVGCNKATWRAYVVGYLSLVISCTPNWMLEVDVEVLKRVGTGLKQWNEGDMAVALLGISGIGAMAAAAEMIIETD